MLWTEYPKSSRNSTETINNGELLFFTSSINHFNELLQHEVHVYPHFKRVLQEEIDVAKGSLWFTVTVAIDLIVMCARLTIERHRALLVAKPEQLKNWVSIRAILVLLERSIWFWCVLLTFLTFQSVLP